jgi:hypothetical protein
VASGGSGDTRRVSVRLPATVLVLAAGLVLALAGCGGDDDDTEGGATTAQAANERLSATAWDSYVQTRDQARAVNDAAITKFQACRRLVFTKVPVEQVQMCMAKPTEEVVAESEKVLASIDDVADDAAGACESALDTLNGNVKLYASTIKAIGLSVQRADLPSPNEIDESVRMLGATRAANTAVERACRPA